VTERSSEGPAATAAGGVGGLPAARRGRPRRPGIDERILAATVELVSEGGFDAVVMDAVAARAGVSKATVYARWSTKGELVVAAISCYVGAALPPPPDTGDVREDLRQLYTSTAVGLTGLVGRLIPPLVGEIAHNPTLAAAFRTQFVEPRRQRVRAVIERGIGSGQLAGTTNVELLVDLGAAFVFHRLLVTGGAIGPDLADALIAQFLPPNPVPRRRPRPSSAG